MTIPRIDAGRTAVLRIQAQRTLDASDLALLMSSLEAIYGVFLTYQFLSRVGRDPVDPLNVIAGDQLRASVLLLEQGWPSGIRPSDFDLQDPELVTREFDARLIGWEPAVPDYATKRQALLRYLRSGIYRAIPAATLRVHSIQISSPGPISLAGLGEPLRELRELIKDLWYRNRQERQRGELEIEEARMRLARTRREIGLSTDQPAVGLGAVILANGAKSMHLLAEQGKVDPDSFDLEPE